MTVKSRDNTSDDGKQPRDQSERRKKIIREIVFVVLVLVIIILLLRSCEQNPLSPDNPYGDTQGEWNVGDKKEESQDPEVVPDNITFSGREKYTVTSKQKEMELMNPQINQANFVFTVRDAQSGVVIAKTGKVKPGQYAYINVYDYFDESGNYDVIIEIAVYSYAGKQLNGANSKAVVTVNK